MTCNLSYHVEATLTHENVFAPTFSLNLSERDLVFHLKFPIKWKQDSKSFLQVSYSYLTLKFAKKIYGDVRVKF